MLTHNGKILLIAAFFIVILSSLVVAADSWKDIWIEGDITTVNFCPNHSVSLVDGGVKYI